MRASDWGKIIAHSGFGIIIFGISSITAWETEDIRVVRIGETFSVGTYKFTLNDVINKNGPNYVSTVGILNVVDEKDNYVTTLEPEKRFFPTQSITTTEASIDNAFSRDIYIVLGAQQGEFEWVVRTYIKPFVNWIWLGAFILSLGGMLSIFDKKVRIGIASRKSKLFKTMQRYFFLLILIFLLPLSLSGVEPDEILKDKILEERARIISSDLRCLVCQNENIDSSNADLAKDLRLLVRERLLVGDTNKQVKNFIVERYGEYVLLNPTFSGSSILLWISGPLIFILSFIILILRYLSFRKKNITKQVVHSAEDLKKTYIIFKKVNFLFSF